MKKTKQAQPSHDVLEAPPGFFVQKYDGAGLMLPRDDWTVQRLPKSVMDSEGLFW